MAFNQKELDKILKWFKGSDLTSATVECDADGGYKVTLSRESTRPQLTEFVVPQPTLQRQSVQSDANVDSGETETANVAADVKNIESPIVGTFYRSPGPDSPPFVQEGDTVKKGQTLCIIEAMKVMNELEAEFDMEIVSIQVDNNGLVEFGQTLFEVKAL